MADCRHFKNSFLTITRQPIVWFQKFCIVKHNSMAIEVILWCKYNMCTYDCIAFLHLISIKRALSITYVNMVAIGEEIRAFFSARTAQVHLWLEIAIPSHFESSGIAGLLCQISGNSGIFSGISLYSINLFQNSIYRFILRRNLLSSLLHVLASPLTWHCYWRSNRAYI